MAKKHKMNFYLGFVIPSFLSICLFIISLYAIIIPAFEKNSMAKKKEMISELTHTAWSLVDEYRKEYSDSVNSVEQAKKLAAERIEKMRYGKQGKDYFWIINKEPRMVMHPYRKELNDTDLSDYKEKKKKKLFVEAVKLVEEQGEGFIEYIWQWKDDSTRMVPKLSFVKGIEGWDWIIGTGIYLEDVKEEIRAMENRILRISFAISLIIILLLLFILRQSHILQKRRKEAENKLRLSHQKYHSLVQASVDGTVMLVDDQVIFSNYKFTQMLDCPSKDILGKSFDDLFTITWEEVNKRFQENQRSVICETQLKSCQTPVKDMVITVSKIDYAGKESTVVITKDITRKRQIEKETGKLSDEIQTSLLLMNQPIRHLVKDCITCSLEESIREAAKKMTRKQQKIIFITKDREVIGVINDKDLRERIISQNSDTDVPVALAMTSPVIKIRDNALLYEALLQFKKENISHLAVINEKGRMTGTISRLDVLEMQKNSLTFLIREIEVTEDIVQLRAIHEKVPVIVNALMESGHNVRNITRIITSLSDAISKRLITLAVEETGQTPPCKFAFIAMGSEGRMEQTLVTDQDNAIIFEDIEDDKIEDAYAYFRNLGKIVNTNLDKIGFQLCKGGIMAMNEKWTQPLRVWKKNFTSWINNSDPQSLLDMSIVFDFRCIYGQSSFCSQLRNHVHENITNKAVFFYHMAQSVTKFRAPVSFFGSIVGEADPDDAQIIDIKRILLPVISFIRIYALKNNISETNSLERLEEIKKQNSISKAIYDELVLSYNYLMLLRFRFQTEELLNNKKPDNSVDISNLTNIEITTLKKIFSHISELQTKLNFDFKGGM